jgi:hypothetical protein
MANSIELRECPPPESTMDADTQWGGIVNNETILSIAIPIDAETMSVFIRFPSGTLTT